jgi:hypothetical protein
MSVSHVLHPCMIILDGRRSTFYLFLNLIEKYTFILFKCVVWTCNAWFMYEVRERNFFLYNLHSEQ